MFGNFSKIQWQHTVRVTRWNKVDLFHEKHNLQPRIYFTKHTSSFYLEEIYASSHQPVLSFAIMIRFIREKLVSHSFQHIQTAKTLESINGFCF